MYFQKEYDFDEYYHSIIYEGYPDDHDKNVCLDNSE